MTTSLAILLLIGTASLCAGIHLRQRQQQHATADRADALVTLGRAAVSMAHDINNILTGVLGHAEMIELGCCPEQGRAAAGEIRELCICAGRMTNFVMSIAVPSSVKPKPLDVAQHLRSLEPILATLTRRDVKVDINGGGEPAYIEAAAVCLDKMLINLALNASEAGASTIEVTATFNDAVSTDPRSAFDGRRIRIEVADDGPGMSDDALCNATEFLFTRNKPTGSGIGLSTVESTARALDGRFELRNRDGGGIVAKIDLPALPPPVSIARENRPAAG